MCWLAITTQGSQRPQAATVRAGQASGLVSQDSPDFDFSTLFFGQRPSSTLSSASAARPPRSRSAVSASRASWRSRSHARAPVCVRQAAVRRRRGQQDRVGAPGRSRPDRRRSGARSRVLARPRPRRSRSPPDRYSARSHRTSALIAARAIIGIGAAALEPGTLSVLRHVFSDRRERARAVGTWAAVTGLALAFGPVVGGALVGAAGWRGVFWFNLA